MTGVIDAHVHVIVPAILRDGQGGEEWRPRVRREPGGGHVVEFDGREIRSMVQEVVDIETILASSLNAGIDGVVLSPWVPLLYPNADAQACLERCRIQNEALAEIVAGRRDRIAALGAVPLQDSDLAATELRALRRDGVLSGVEVTTSVQGAYLGDPRFEVFWQAAAETDALVFVHPTTRGFDDPVFSEYYLWNTVGNPFETTIAAAQMTMAGVMERHPALRVLLAHGGGALMALRGRLRHAHGFQPQARSRLTESPLDSIRRFFFDTVMHDRELLRGLIEWVGHDRVVLGSDYPFDMADPDPIASVRALGLARAHEDAVLGRNAERLIAGAGREAAHAGEVSQ